MFCNNGGVYVRCCVFLQRSSTRGVVTRTQNKASCLEKRIISMQEIRHQCRPVFVNASLHCRKYRKIGSSSRICCFYPITWPAQIKMHKHLTSFRQPGLSRLWFLFRPSGLSRQPGPSRLWFLFGPFGLFRQSHLSGP